MQLAINTIFQVQTDMTVDDLIHKDVDITSYTTFGIKVKAKYFAEYSNVRQLEAIMRTPEYQQNEVLHIGGGSNLLFANDYNGFVLHSRIEGITEYRKNDTTVYVIAGAGVKWTDLVDYCVEHGLAGLENLAGIPGEAGASAIQNVGAYGVEAKDHIFKVECYDRLSHKIVNFTNEECRFGYRDSIFKHEAKGRYFVLRVCYKLTPCTIASDLNYGPLKSLAEQLGHAPTLHDVRNTVIAIRNTKLPDPRIIGSAGSFFKNPIVPAKFYKNIVLARDPETPHYELPDEMVKIPAGWLIEHAGLKGCRLGGAEIYPKQCLVIANTGNASAAAVMGLCTHVRETILQKYGILLHPEVNIIDTDIHVEILGSGTSKGVPEPGCACEVCLSSDSRDKRTRASVLVRTHGLALLIDASPDLRYQILRSGTKDIDATLLTHQHYDHVGGIDDLRTFCMDKDMPVYMRHAVSEDLHRRLDYCFRKHPYPGVPTFDVHEIDKAPFYIEGLKIIPITVMHADLPIVGYRIGNFAYITDAKTIDDEEADKLKGVKTLIINALRHRPHFSHFSVDEAIALINKIKPQEAYLTHICHDMGLHEIIDRQLPDNVKLAYDSLKLLIK